MKQLLALLSRGALLSAVACGVYGTVAIGLKVPMIGWGVLGLLAWGRSRRLQRRGGGYAYGTARVANAVDLHAHALLGHDDGLIMGRASYTAGPGFGEAFRTLLTLPPWRSDTAVALMFAAFAGKRWGRDDIIRLRDTVNLLTCACVGAGKGVSVLIPNLLSYSSSCVVTDPKGELFSITSEHRKHKLHHRIIRIDPFGLGGPGSDTWNPIDLLDANSPYLLDQAKDLASMLVVRTGKEHERHWNDMAEAVLTTFIAYVAACETTPGCRNLQTVRDLVCNRQSFDHALKMIQKSHVCDGMLSRQGAAISWLVDRELGSVLSTVQRHTSFLDSPAIAASTAASSFAPRELRSKRMTVYLCLPPDKLVSLAPLQRMWIGSMLRAVAMGGANERNPVLFLLDEAGNLGHIQALEDAVTLLRGYGVRLWFFFQSMGQLTTCYGERAATFLDNIGTQQVFGINAYDSADLISKRMGDATITNNSYNRTSSHSRSYDNKGQGGVNISTGDSITVSELGRRLLKPEELMCLPADTAVIFHRNLPPIIAKLLRYYDAPEFQKRGIGRSRRSGFGRLLQSLGFLWVAACFAVFAAAMPSPPPRQATARPRPVDQYRGGPYRNVRARPGYYRMQRPMAPITRPFPSTPGM